MLVVRTFCTYGRPTTTVAQEMPFNIHLSNVTNHVAGAGAGAGPFSPGFSLQFAHCQSIPFTAPPRNDFMPQTRVHADTHTHEIAFCAFFFFASALTTYTYIIWRTCVCVCVFPFESLCIIYSVKKEFAISSRSPLFAGWLQIPVTHLYIFENMRIWWCASDVLGGLGW